MFILWTLFAFFLGSLPHSLWIGQIMLGKDIRAYGDQNPGATNVLRAGGRVWYGLALIADIGKGALPVGLAYFVFGWQGWEIVPIALAPPLGHAFSPFLRGRGGKAVAATFGTWMGLTLWQVPLVSLILLIIFSLLLAPAGWAVVFTLLATAVYLLIWLPNPLFLAVLVGHILLLLWTHRQDLGQRPRRRRS